MVIIKCWKFRKITHPKLTTWSQLPRGAAMEVLTVFLVLGRWRLNDWKFRPPWLHGSQPNWGLNLGPDMLDRLSTLNFFLNLHFIYWGGAHTWHVSLGRSEDSLQGGSRNWTLVIRRGSKCLCPSSHLTNPYTELFYFYFLQGQGVDERMGWASLFLFLFFWDGLRKPRLSSWAWPWTVPPASNSRSPITSDSGLFI